MKAEQERKSSLKCRNILSCMSALLFFLLYFVSPSYAHKVYLFAWAEGDTIYTESYFSGSKKVQDGIIKVFDSDGNELLTGKTNDKGEFSFRIPKTADLKIVLESSMGHGAEYLFKKSEFAPEDKAAAKIPADTALDEPETYPKAGADQVLAGKEIEEALDAKLKPVIRELAKLREDKGPGVTEVIGGIGYIFGIMGIIAYMKSKKK